MNVTLSAAANHWVLNLCPMTLSPELASVVGQDPVYCCSFNQVVVLLHLDQRNRDQCILHGGRAS